MHRVGLKDRINRGYLICEAINNIHTCFNCGVKFNRHRWSKRCPDCNKQKKYKTKSIVDKCKTCSRPLRNIMSNWVYCSEECRKNRKRDRKEYHKEWYKNKSKEKKQLLIDNWNAKERIKCNEKIRNNKTFITYYISNGILKVKEGKQGSYQYKIFTQVKQNISCNECGIKYTALSPLYYNFCSSKCGNKNTKRKHRLKRKALKREVSVELIDPIVVFNMQDWRCQLCGIKTPITKRGTYNNDAPELDHIIPLSKGGEHSYRNVQTLCRRCNSIKKDNVYD